MNDPNPVDHVIRIASYPHRKLSASLVNGWGA